MAETNNSTNDISEDPLRRLNSPFDEMFSAEMDEWVTKLPKYEGGASEPTSPHHPDPRNHLVGLAMSGGGTRSATFNLGVTQALAHYGFMNQVDYMATISGGGYLGASFTSLCGGDFDLKRDGRSVHLGMAAKTFPYADQNPYPEPSIPSIEERESPVVHGLETPATRHVRENSRLLIPGLGIFNRENWVSVSRYTVSTILLWVLFLLPMATAILLPTILIPVEVWNRSDPFSVGPFDRIYSLGNQPWIAVAPLAILGVAAILALLPIRKGADNGSTYRTIIVFAQNLSILGMAVTAAAALLVLGVWGYSTAVERVPEWGLGIIGGGSAGMAFASLRTLLNLPDSIKRRILDVIFAIFGYLVLGAGLVAWYYFLWNGWDALGGWQGFNHSLNGYWIAWVGVGGILAFSWGLAPWLLNFLSLNRMYEERIQRTWIVSPTPGGSSENIKTGKQMAGWTRVWERPDLTVGNLIPKETENWQPATPYPLVCTTLNLSGSTSPKLLNRRADSFVIGPAYTGSALTRWRPTSALASFRNMPIARH